MTNILRAGQSICLLAIFHYGIHRYHCHFNMHHYTKLRLIGYLIGDHFARLFNDVGVRCMCFTDYCEFDCRLEHIPTNIDISSRAYLKLITTNITMG